MKKKQENTEIGLPLGEYYKRCDERMDKALALVKERIQGTRKGLPDELNYLHSFRVMDMVSAHHHWDDPDYHLFTAALLHDIVEDGGVSFEELENMGFTARTIELVRLCSHRMDIKNSTERWVLMIAKLVRAKDEDAWRIKMADLVDNLKQSKGLSPENRRFMVEVKAPLMIRLTADVYYSARVELAEETERQRAQLAEPADTIGSMRPTRFVLWIDEDKLIKDAPERTFVWSGTAWESWGGSV